MAALSAIWLGVDAAQAVSRGDSLDSLWHGYGSVVNWAILLWPAVGPWGIGKGIQVRAPREPVHCAHCVHPAPPMGAK